jgi:hypothetical protein
MIRSMIRCLYASIPHRFCLCLFPAPLVMMAADHLAFSLNMRKQALLLTLVARSKQASEHCSTTAAAHRQASCARHRATCKQTHASNAIALATACAPTCSYTSSSSFSHTHTYTPLPSSTLSHTQQTHRPLLINYRQVGQPSANQPCPALFVHGLSPFHASPPPPRARARPLSASLCISCPPYSLPPNACANHCLANVF